MLAVIECRCDKKNIEFELQNSVFQLNKEIKPIFSFTESGSVQFK